MKVTTLIVTAAVALAVAAPAFANEHAAPAADAKVEAKKDEHKAKKDAKKDDHKAAAPAAGH